MQLRFSYSLLLLTLVSMTVTANNGVSDTADFSNVRIEKSYSSVGFDFFDSEEPLRIRLSFDVKRFIKTKSSPENFDAVIQIYTPNDTLVQNIKVKARGEMRRNYCSFPPIMLKFKDKEGTEEILNEGNLKVVTHCDQSATAESYVFKEYLAYKLYNHVTPYSFRTRLAYIEYKDENSGLSITEFGFIIESVDQLAQRNNSMVIDNPKISQKHMDDYEMARVAFFNYMIGNTDWSVTEQHNIKVLRPLDVNADKGIPVAYDFDYSGFVNTRYSAPAKLLPINYVTDRYYLGSCVSDEILTVVIDEFEEMRAQFINTIENFNYLSRGQKKKAETYIAGFFKRYRTDEVLLSELIRTCKKI